jgi:hypothetical protein
MSKPRLEDFMDCCARWNDSHRGIRYELSWHGRSDYSPQGTWCYYIFVNSEEFYADDWQRLRLEREDKQYFGGMSWHRHYNYDAFPDLDAHCGWTFGEMNTYLGKDGKEYEQVKVGCDYQHLYDRENDFWQGRADVERDAKRSIDLLCEMFPRRRQRCSYSGQYDDADQFYTARNGSIVHKRQQDKFDDGWAAWRPAEGVLVDVGGRQDG